MQIEPKPPTAKGPADTEGVAPGDERPETDWGEHVTDDEYQGR